MLPFTFFISYRRDDATPLALLLKHEIERRLQFVRVALDVGERDYADALPERVRRLIDGAHATLALIGPHWMPHRGDVAAAIDPLTEELVYARTAPIALPEAERYGLVGRVLVPLFADCAGGVQAFELPPHLGFLKDLAAEHIECAHWPERIGPLLDRLAVRLALKKRPDADEFPAPDPARAHTQPLADEELARLLGLDDLAGWYLEDYGNAQERYLAKTFRFPDFDRAVEFMALVSAHCRVLDHHPEWRNVYNRVTVSLTTWDARRRVTLYDLNLALYMNRAAATVLRQAGG